jgi:DNA replication protein DnaC
MNELKQFTPKSVVGRLIKDGYLKERHKVDEICDALNKWRNDHPTLKPFCPSLVDPYREAECVKCRDLGMVYPLGIDKKPDYTQIIPCSCGVELDKANAQRYALEHSGIPNVPRVVDFEAFVLDERTQGAGNAFESASNLAMGKSDYKLIFLYGGHGNGKSHLCYASALEAIKRGKRAKYINFIELCSQVRATIKKSDIDMEDVLGEYKKCEFLCLDEVRLEKIDSWAARILEELVGYRYDRELPTIMTSNHEVNELPEPVQSRLSDTRLARCFKNTAPDFRPRNKKLNRNFTE